ncbi:MAG: ABC transporter substrate-binding protein [Geminicoccaceae bacterium]
MRRYLMTLAVAAGLVGAGASSEAETLRVGVEGAYPPFSMVNADGKLEGFDIDIAYALCEEMGVECELIAQDWDGIIPALLARKYDAIVASMSITEERKQTVDFTQKYYQTPAKFVRPKGSDIEITEQDLDGKRVGVQRATIHDNYLTDNYEGKVEIVRYGTQEEANLDLVAGRVDLLLADSITLDEGFLQTEAGQDFEFVGPDLTDPKWFGEGAGIAIRKDDDELDARLNAAIDAIRENGTYDKIAAKYFDFNVYGS